MPQSLDSVLLHLVFSTKNRAAYLDENIRPQVYAYLARTCREVGCECERIGGVEDHVHLAVRLARTLSIAALVEALKTSSSKWLKTKSPHLSGFAWQKGYAVFSVGPTDAGALVAYIDGQAEHHRRVTFQEEYRTLLEEHGVSFDERYVWD
jgi:REP element-mobilizing transposase RayT